MGDRYLVVGMATGSPGGCCGLDNGLGSDERKVELWAGYGLVHASDRAARLGLPLSWEEYPQAQQDLLKEKKG